MPHRASPTSVTLGTTQQLSIKPGHAIGKGVNSLDSLSIDKNRKSMKPAATNRHNLPFLPMPAFCPSPLSAKPFYLSDRKEPIKTRDLRRYRIKPMSLSEFSMAILSTEYKLAPASKATDLPSPADLGGWRPVTLAAEGAMSKVYRAKAPVVAESKDAASAFSEPGYALKILKESWSKDARAIEFFVREAQLGRTIADPHIVAVLASRVKSGRPPYYLVMPWLEGRTLREELDDRGVLALPEAFWIARQVSEAIAALDRLGYYHGDLKPSNLFLAPSGHVTLLDLGFARHVHETRPDSKQFVTGTYRYMAPEVTSSAYTASIQSDVYSLGVILFELLAGRPPFEGSSAQELLEQHRSARPPRLSRLQPGIPPYVCDFVDHLLAKQPDRRPSISDGLIDELTRLEIRTFGER